MKKNILTIVLIVSFALVGGIVGFKISEAIHSPILNDYMRLAREVNQKGSELNICKVEIQRCKTLTSQ